MDAIQRLAAAQKLVDETLAQVRSPADAQRAYTHLRAEGALYRASGEISEAELLYTAAKELADKYDLAKGATT